MEYKYQNKIEKTGGTYTIYFKVIGKSVFNKGKVINALKNAGAYLEMKNDKDAIFGVSAENYNSKTDFSGLAGGKIIIKDDYFNDVKSKLEAIGNCMKKIDDGLASPKLKEQYKNALVYFQESIFGGPIDLRNF